MEQRAALRASQHVNENVDAVFALYAEAERKLPSDQRGIERVVAALGRPRFLYFYLCLAILWVAGNLLAPYQGAEPFDAAPFFWLQGCVGASSLLMTIIILIAQNRQGRLAEQRAHLDLQVNLLAERKIAKLIALIEELRRDIPSVRDRYDGVAEAMAHPADPQRVAQAVDDKINPKP